MARGRPSKAVSEAKKRFIASIELRPKPPAVYGLTKEEREVWENVVNGVPPGWFTSANFPLLASYCRLTLKAKTMAEWAAEAKAAGNTKSYLKWSRSEGSMGRLVMAIGGKLKINKTASGHGKRDIERRIQAEQGTIGKPLSKVTPWSDANEPRHPALAAVANDDDNNLVSEAAVGQATPSNPAPDSALDAASALEPPGPEPVLLPSTDNEDTSLSVEGDEEEDEDDFGPDDEDDEDDDEDEEGMTPPEGERSAPVRPWDN